MNLIALAKKDPLKAIKIIEALAKKEIEGDILKWGLYYFPHKFDQEFCYELHDYLVGIRDSELTATHAPREHAKTTISCFLIPIYTALNEPELYKHYLNVQNTSSKSIAINLSIREEIEKNEKLIADYGDLMTDEKWTEKQFVLANGVIFSAVGAGESIRGINYKNIRPDFINADDIYDEEDINNADRIKKKTNWFWSSLYPARNSRHSVIHLLGTAISKNDLLHSLEKDKTAKYKKFKAIKDYDKKITLWMPFDNLMRDKNRMGSIIFERELQNECRDDATSIVKESWIKYYDGNIPVDETIEKIVGAVDPASGEKQQNDFTGYACVKRSNLKNYYIDDLGNEKLSFNERIKYVVSKHEKNKHRNVYVEAISAFHDFAVEIRRTTGVPIREINKVKDKISRFESQSAKFENGKVFINKNIPERLRNELVEQLINNHPDHDDMRDAVILALEDEERDPVIMIL